MSDQIAEMSATYLVEAGPDAVPEGYKQTEVGVIPEDWKEVSVAEILTEISMGPFGSDIKVSNFVPAGVPVLNGANVSTHKLKDNFSNFVTEEKAKALKKAVASRGDIVVTHRGTIGQISYIPNNSLFEKYVISQSQFRARFNSKTLPIWVVLYFLSPRGAQRLLECKGHTGVPAIAQATTTFRKLKLPLPGIKEQTAIANALSDVDALISELEKLIAKKQAIKTATMQQLLTGRTRLPQFALRENGTPKGYKQSKLGEIPEDWGVHKLSELCDVRDGTHDSPKYKNTGVPLITSKNIVNNMLDFSSITFISKEAAFEINKRSKVDCGDIIMSMIGTVGSAILVKDEPNFCIKNVALFKPKTKTGQFLIQFIRSNIFQDYLEDGLDGGIQKFVSLGTLRALEISIPLCQIEQTAIATILSEMDDEIQTLEQRLGKTRQIKQGMMQELLTGKTRLVVPAA